MDAPGRFPQTILATCCVPWHDDGSLAEDVFRGSIRDLLAHGLRDLYIFGTAGEGYAVDERRFDAVVDVFSEELRSQDAEPMVGVISLSLATIIERIERCAQRGIELFQISLPSWGALRDRELDTFFAETCGRFPDLRFLHYNLPRARRMLSPDDYAALAERHPNLVATKNATADRSLVEGLLTTRARALRHFFTEPGYRYGSLLGACGLLISVALLNPALARAYFSAGRRGDAATVEAFGTELAAISAELADAVGADRIDGAYDKCFSRVHDPRFPLRLLPPYEGASGEAYERFLAAVRDRHPRWLTHEESPA